MDVVVGARLGGSKPGALLGDVEALQTLPLAALVRLPGCRNHVIGVVDRYRKGREIRVVGLVIERVETIVEIRGARSRSR